MQLAVVFFKHGIYQTISFKTQSFHFSQAFELLLPPSFHEASEEQNHTKLCGGCLQLLLFAGSAAFRKL